MSLDGINETQQAKNFAQYSMEALGIKENSKEASIFNRIDKSDGREDGFLNDEQYLQYLAETGQDNKKNFFVTFLEKFRRKPLGPDNSKMVHIDNTSGKNVVTIETIQEASYPNREAQALLEVKESLEKIKQSGNEEDIKKIITLCAKHYGSNDINDILEKIEAELDKMTLELSE